MAGLPKRALDFGRVAKSEKGGQILSSVQLTEWSRIFGWTYQPPTSVALLLSKDAEAKSKSKK